MTRSPKLIYEAVLAKWNYLVENPKALGKSLDEIEYVKGRFLSEFNDYARCGYCSRFIEKDCKECPLNIIIGYDQFTNIGCLKKGHPYKVFNQNKTKKNAQAVLNLIIETKDSLFNQVK